MTLRTTSATRRSVVSRSSDVAKTSATSSSKDSTGKRSGLEMTELITRYDSSRAAGLISAIFLRPLECQRKNRASPAGQLFSRHDANIREIAIFFRVIEPVADHELVRNLKADVIAFERKLAPRRLVEQGGDFERTRLPRHQHLFQIGHGQAGVENV